MEVFKFGGTCIQCPENLQKLGQIIKVKQHGSLVLVFSAFGKTTIALERIIQKKLAAQPYRPAIKQLYEFHQKIVAQLLGPLQPQGNQAITQWEAQLLKVLSCPTPTTEVALGKLYSEVVASGELLASQLIYYYLQACGITVIWLDARTFIKTHKIFYNAKVDWRTTQHCIRRIITPYLQQHQIVVTQGFIGSNRQGETTTLGKEGSDFTGAIVANVLNAQSLTIWKDVPGVMNADPQWFKNAIKFNDISYKLMAEMAFYGAKVLHPHTIQPLAAQNIPLYVRPFKDPHHQGTKVSNAPMSTQHPIYILQRDRAFVQLHQKKSTFFDENCLRDALASFTKYPTHINMLIKSPHTLQICCSIHPTGTHRLLTFLRKEFEIHYQAPVKLLTTINHEGELPKKGFPKSAILAVQKIPGVCQIVWQHDTAVPYIK